MTTPWELLLCFAFSVFLIFWVLHSNCCLPLALFIICVSCHVTFLFTYSAYHGRTFLFFWFFFCLPPPPGALLSPQGFVRPTHQYRSPPPSRCFGRGHGPAIFPQLTGLFFNLAGRVRGQSVEGFASGYPVFLILCLVSWRVVSTTLFTEPFSTQGRRTPHPVHGRTRGPFR